MTIDHIDKIDLIGIENTTGNVILTISDHLNWEDHLSHLKVLQEKINTYLRFIESDEIYQSYPSARGKKIIIEVVGKYDLTLEARVFYFDANLIIQKMGSEIRFTQLK